jgi:hypothetical protein
MCSRNVAHFDRRVCLALCYDIYVVRPESVSTGTNVTRKKDALPLTSPKKNAEQVRAANVCHSGINLFLNICKKLCAFNLYLWWR